MSRGENIIAMTDTIWQLNRHKVIDKLEEMSGQKIPEECMKLIEYSFRFGAMYMESANGKNWRKHEEG